MALNFGCFICHQPNETTWALYQHLLNQHLIGADGRRNQGVGVDRCLDVAIVERYRPTQISSQKCKYCDDPFVRPVDVDRHMVAKYEDIIKCNVKFCPYASKDMTSFDVHRRKHALFYGCTKPECGEWFVLPGEYTEHFKQLNHMCSKCGQVYHTRSELERHESQC